MENPAEEIKQVIQLLCTAASPDIQKATVERYFCIDAGFRHPLCTVTSGYRSRDEILGIYQWYRILSPKVSITTTSVMYDADQARIIADSTQLFHIRWNILPPAPARLITHIQLREIDGKHYISLQEDWYHPDDFMNLLVPLITPLIRAGLRAGTVSSNVLASIFQVVFGWWRPGAGQIMHNVDGLGHPGDRHD
ncbi:hypothetical protein OE88DRAFT_1680384 [Heliocybe sulcata]|uniref:SigF-like NTF2-like domain-containing protein n=1 Tax=Heliocybe sulcata TaxID=5364 RepID=A0A5C3N5Z8_9AGAM|nr:hypothetical protein OE88DRAFT_1680384 [Heliocybe sulcata]